MIQKHMEFLSSCLFFVDFINLCAETIFSLHILKLVEICILSQDVNNLYKFLCELEIKGFFSILM